MLPDFDDYGNLPPGIHLANIKEVEARFGRGSSERRMEVEELNRFVDWAIATKVRRMVVNGSFVTSARAPNDVDIVVLPSPETLEELQATEFDSTAWPFLQIIFVADDDDFNAGENVIF